MTETSTETRIDLSHEQAERLASLSANKLKAEDAMNMYLRSILDGQGINGIAASIKLDAQTLIVTPQET